MIHRSHDYASVYLGKVGHEIELQSLRRIRQRGAADGEDDHQYQERDHHVLGHAFQTALQIEAQDTETYRHGDREKNDIDPRVGYHINEVQARVLPDKEFPEIIQHPAGDDRIERHKSDISQKGEPAVDMPFGARFFKLLIHAQRACLGSAAHGKLHDHDGESEDQQAEDIYQNESAAAVLTGHPRELPNVPAADGAARAQKYEAESAAESFSSIVHKNTSFT